eukprot:1204280-Lingulodinium_polyedra.AAC.1
MIAVCSLRRPRRMPPLASIVFSRTSMTGGGWCTMATHRDPGVSVPMAAPGVWDYACCGVGTSTSIAVAPSARASGSSGWLVVGEEVPTWKGVLTNHSHHQHP